MSDLTITLRGRGQHDWPYVYAHRAAEALLNTLNHVSSEEGIEPPDLISANLALDTLADGEHTCSVLDQPAIAFLWTAQRKLGLVVLASDLEGITDARSRYAAKVPIL